MVRQGLECNKRKYSDKGAVDTSFEKWPITPEWFSNGIPFMKHYNLYFSILPDVCVAIIFFSFIPADSWNKQSSSAIPGLTYTHRFIEGLSGTTWKGAETSTIMCGSLQTYLSVDITTSKANVSIICWVVNNKFVRFRATMFASQKH